MITINVEKATTSESVQKQIPEHLKGKSYRYKDTVFNGKIGKLKDYKAKVKIGEKVPPIAHRERRLPFTVRQQVNEEIEKLEKAGIFETVTDELTPWVSQMDIVLKPNGNIRLCVDMRGPNQAIQRTRYPIPTLVGR